MEKDYFTIAIYVPYRYLSKQKVLEMSLKLQQQVGHIVVVVGKLCIHVEDHVRHLSV